MKLVYDRPTLDTKFDVPCDYTSLKVNSAQDVKRIQEQILDITDLATKFLKEYELPQGIDGEVLVTFRGYNAKAKGRGRFGRIKVVGVLGFPQVAIQTDLGASSVSWYPEQGLSSVECLFFPNHPYRGYGNLMQIGISGGVLADKVAQEMLPSIKSKFATRPVKVESFGEHQPQGYLSKRITIPV